MTFSITYRNPSAESIWGHDKNDLTDISELFELCKNCNKDEIKCMNIFLIHFDHSSMPRWNIGSINIENCQNLFIDISLSIVTSIYLL